MRFVICIVFTVFLLISPQRCAHSCALFRVGAVAVRTEPFACTMMRTFSRRTLIACAFGAYDALMLVVCLLA